MAAFQEDSFNLTGDGTPERVPGMLAKLASLPLHFRGFHIFCGSQNLRADAIIEAQTNTFELAFRLAEVFGLPVGVVFSTEPMKPLSDVLRDQLEKKEN